MTEWCCRPARGGSSEPDEPGPRRSGNSPGMRLKLDTKLRCADKARARLSDVVVDPVARRVTHVVVEARGDVARLVPLGLMATPGALSCTAAELQACEPIREYAFLQLDEYPHGDKDHDVGVETMITTPSSDAVGYGGFAGELDSGVGLVYDWIPRGDAELRSSSSVYSSDGHRLGHLDSVLVLDGALTHVVAREGHFWKTHTLAIPIDAIAEISTDRVTAALPRDEANALPKLSRADGATSRSSGPSADVH